MNDAAPRKCRAIIMATIEGVIVTIALASAGSFCVRVLLPELLEPAPKADDYSGIIGIFIWCIAGCIGTVVCIYLYRREGKGDRLLR
jgi:hypothetical protein